VEVVASLSQGRTAAMQCGLFTHKSVPVIFEPPCVCGYIVVLLTVTALGVCSYCANWKLYRSKLHYFFFETEVLMLVTTKITIFLDDTPCSLAEIYWRFERIHCLKNVGKFLPVCNARYPRTHQRTFLVTPKILQEIR